LFALDSFGSGFFTNALLSYFFFERFGASPGAIGTAVAQYELRRYLGVLNALVLNQPSVMIGQAAAKFDEQGRLTDQPTRDFIGKLLVALAEWTRRCRT